MRRRLRTRVGAVDGRLADWVFLLPGFGLERLALGAGQEVGEVEVEGRETYCGPGAQMCT